MRLADLISGSLLLAVSLLFLFVIIPAQVGEGEWYGLSPFFYPNLIAGAIAVFSLWLIVQAAVGKNAYEGREVPLSFWQIGIFLIAGLLILCGVMIVERFGIWVGGPVTILAVMLLMGERRPLVLGPTAILPVVCIYTLVRFVLHAPLP
jgi:hypothetical protein